MVHCRNAVKAGILAALVAVLTIILGAPQVAWAQVSSQGGQTYGTFGSRTLGQPLGPRPTMYGAGFQTGSTGTFLYPGQSAGTGLFSAPWRRVAPVVAAPAANVAAPAAPAAQPAAAAAVPQNSLPESPPNADMVPAQPEANGAEGTGSADQGLGAAPGAGQSAAWNYSDTLGGAPASTPSARRPQPSVRSPELSELLTRIARSKGMLTGQGIDVYVGNVVTLVRGNVRLPSDRVLLARILALEPGVRQIDNRLVAKEPDAPAADRSSL